VEAQPNGTGNSVTCVGGQSILVAGTNADAICGDLGSFSAAAASPGPDRSPEPGHNGENRGRGNAPSRPEKPEPDPDQGGGGSQTMNVIDEEPFELS
jgi:hypothetical protein